MQDGQPRIIVADVEGQHIAVDHRLIVAGPIPVVVAHTHPGGPGTQHAIVIRDADRGAHPRPVESVTIGRCYVEKLIRQNLPVGAPHIVVDTKIRPCRRTVAVDSAAYITHHSRQGKSRRQVGIRNVGRTPDTESGQFGGIGIIVYHPQITEKHVGNAELVVHPVEVRIPHRGPHRVGAGRIHCVYGVGIDRCQTPNTGSRNHTRIGEGRTLGRIVVTDVVGYQILNRDVHLGGDVACSTRKSAVAFTVGVEYAEGHIQRISATHLGQVTVGKRKHGVGGSDRPEIVVAGIVGGADLYSQRTRCLGQVHAVNVKISAGRVRSPVITETGAHFHRAGGGGRRMCEKLPVGGELTENVNLVGHDHVGRRPEFQLHVNPTGIDRVGGALAGVESHLVDIGRRGVGESLPDVTPRIGLRDEFHAAGA